MKNYKPFIDYLEKSEKARNEEELFRIFQETVLQYGYDLAAFSLLTDHKDLRLKASFGVFTNFPVEWVRYYAAHGLGEIDPVISYAMHKSGTFAWKEMSENFLLSTKQKNFLRTAAKAGIHNGLFTPLRGSNNQIAGMALATSRRSPAPRASTDLITAFCNQFYTAYKRFHQSNSVQISVLSLTAKEREILTLASRGKTDPEIGEILKISKHTVNTHLRNIFKKLETNNRVHAVSKALLLGLIRP
jgi:LuxR family quorum sensing-dependent transcriptional regulator